jgi:hypothetical protein
MMTSIRAHFDGKVFIPDEPVGLPPNAPVRLVLVAESDGDRPPLELDQATQGFENDAVELAWLGDSGLKFWDNDIDDEAWNDAVPPA